MVTCETSLTSAVNSGREDDHACRRVEVEVEEGGVSDETYRTLTEHVYSLHTDEFYRADRSLLSDKNKRKVKGKPCGGSTVSRFHFFFCC